MNSKSPIGIFDSGYGGLTIFKEIEKLLPEYDYVYLGDNARTPYGTRSFDLVYEYTLEAVKFLFDQGCELVILACNTASAKALRSIQQLDLPQLAPNKRVLGVIRPSAESITEMTQSGHVGILGTNGTVRSNSYPIEIAKLSVDRSIKVHQQACPMWVPMVENSLLDNPGTNYFVKQDIDQLLAQSPDIDTILLGCTHYPLLLESIRKATPEGVKVVSQGAIVAHKLEDYLTRHVELESKTTKGGTRTFFTTEDTALFDERVAIFLDRAIESRKAVI